MIDTQQQHDTRIAALESLWARAVLEATKILSKNPGCSCAVCDLCRQMVMIQAKRYEVKS